MILTREFDGCLTKCSLSSSDVSSVYLYSENINGNCLIPSCNTCNILHVEISYAKEISTISTFLLGQDNCVTTPNITYISIGHKQQDVVWTGGIGRVQSKCWPEIGTQLLSIAVV